MVNLRSEKEEMIVYEIGYLILPSISEDNLSSVTNAIRKVITTEGGTEIDAEEPVKESLAYSMSKTVGASRYVLSDAYLGWIKFEVDRSKAPAIKVGVEKIEEVLRFLLIKAPRETTFTFAKAREAMETKEDEEAKEALVPSSDEEEMVK